MDECRVFKKKVMIYHQRGGSYARTLVEVRTFVR